MFRNPQPPGYISFFYDNEDGSPTSVTTNTTTSRILCKPAVEAIEAAVMIANAGPSKTIFFDDSPRNIASGKASGLHTVIVGSSSLVPGADHALGNIHNIKEALPEIWEGEGEHFEQVVQPVVVETEVLA